MKTIVLILFPLFSFSQQLIYKNLALEGGGIRGIAYAGAFKVLEENGVLQSIEKVAGSSAGAIAGSMICVGYNAKEIDSMLMSLKFEKLNDGKGGLLGKYRRIKNKFGLYKGDRFELWIRQMIFAKTANANLTFRELHDLHLADKKYKDLYCTGTNLSRQRLEVFSYESTPEFSVATAIRISGGVPLYFTPIALDNNLKKIEKGDTSSFVNYYVDGGMLCNYPICMFDSCVNGDNPLLSDKVVFNKATLGIKLERQAQIDSFENNSTTIPLYNPKSLNQYLDAFINLTMETMARKYNGLENERGRSIYISYGKIHARIKKMSVDNKRFLFNNGANATACFLETNKTLLTKNGIGNK